MVYHRCCGMLFICVLIYILLPSMAAGDTTCLRATIDMSGIKGTITFKQSGSSSTTNITVDLTGDNTSNMNWKIHEFPVGYRGNARHTCQPMYIGSVYDPDNKQSTTDYKTKCSTSAQEQCAIGDLTGKHGNTSRNDDFTDLVLPLNGPQSIFTRSIVFYNGSSTPVFCALIDSCDDVVTAVATFRGNVTGTITLRQKQNSPDLDTAVDVNLFYSKEIANNYDSYEISLSKSILLMTNGLPSYTSTECPTELEKQPTPFTVDVPAAVEGPSTKRKVFNLKNFPLSGVNSVIGRTLVARSLSQGNAAYIICASICERLPLEAQAIFDIDGVSGYLNFKQQSELSATKVEVHLKGLQNKANTYHVHEFQVEKTAVDTKKNMKGSCENVFVAGHWNPYGTISAAPGMGTVDQYEIGDLSGKYGVIGSANELQLNYTDYNLPLFGANSIIYRSMVIHYNDGSRWVCANIYPKDPSLKLKVKAVFDGPDIQGLITVEQASFLKTTSCSCSSSHITTMFTHFEYKDKTRSITKDHNWHIHQYPVSTKEDGLCLSTAGHYNPYAVSLKPKLAYYNECGSDNMLRCELGDNSGKLGRIDIDGSKKRFSESENYFASIYSILGKSIVIHAENSGASRIACSSLVSDSHKLVEKTITFQKTDKTNIDDFRNSLADVMNVCKWQITITNTETYLLCETVTFNLVDTSSSDLASVFEKLKKEWPDTMGSYKPLSKENCKSKSKAAVLLHSTSLMIAISSVFILFN